MVREARNYGKRQLGKKVTIEVALLKNQQGLSRIIRYPSFSMLYYLIRKIKSLTKAY